MKVFLIVCISVHWIVSIIAEEDYCKIDCQGKHHIGCNNNGSYSSACDAKAELLNLDEGLKNTFITLHNIMRDIIAAGEIEQFKPAAQMGSVTWDDELAMLAGLNVKQCDGKHDQCRNTKNYKYAGQNLAMWVSKPAITPKEAIENALNDWFDEYFDANMSVIDKFHTNGKKIENFATLVNEKNSRIGCAILRTPKLGMTAYFTTCNYAHANMLGVPVYKSGKPASGCKSGNDPIYTSLCNTSEKYDV